MHSVLRTALFTFFTFSTFSLIFAKPWHEVNKFNLDGQTCPVPVRENVPCQVVCVSDIQKCPQAVRPDCGVGLNYCVDGTCQQTCPSDAKSLCACKGGFLGGNPLNLPSNGVASLVPCMTVTNAAGRVSNLKVNVTGYSQDPKVGEKPLYEACAKALSIDYKAEGPANAANPFLLQCSPMTEHDLTWTEPEFVFFYVLAFAIAAVAGSHAVYKFIHNRGFKDPISMPTRSRSFKSMSYEDSEVELQDLFGAEVDLTLQFIGYRPDFFGAITLGFIRLASVVLVMLIFVLILDYYAVFSGLTFRDEAMVFVNHTNLSKAFILVWHMTTVWFLILKANGGHNLTYFGRRCPLANATMVKIKKRIEPPVYLAGMGWIAVRVRRIEQLLRKATRTDVSVHVVPVYNNELLDNTGQGRYIEFECVRYIFDEKTNSFEAGVANVGPSHSDLHAQSRGLTSKEARLRRDRIGPNAIMFPADGWFSALSKEFSSFFYIYQMMMLFIWFYYSYYYMGLVLTAVIVISGFGKVFVFLRAQRRVLKMVAFNGTSRVRRDQKWVDLPVQEIVPGDVIEIAEAAQATDHSLSVDVVLISGSVVVDESSLTGEALPVVKFAVKNENVPYSREYTKINSLHAGTRPLQAQSDIEGEPVLGIVTHTGANTLKGRLVRDILYPSPVSFVFNEHLKVVFPLLIFWGIIMLILSIVMLGFGDIDSWFYGMFTISQVLSPLLPAVLVIGQSVASERLSKKGILCVDLARITLSGKVKVFAFDKTGTLTKEGLSFLGVRSVLPGPVFAKAASRGSDLLEDEDEKLVEKNFNSFPSEVRHGLLCCHSVTYVGDQYVGNFVDVEMFRATGGTLEVSLSAGGAATTLVHPSQPGSGTLEIIKRHEFVHAHAYMSAVVHDLSTGKLQVFLKGSFERIKALSNKSSIPADYDSIAERHAGEDGCYVIALAVRDLPSGTTVEQAKSMPREALEQVGSPRVIGLLLFRNELKEDTADALQELREGGCRVVMVTGDNVGTAVHIAKRCGMIRETGLGQQPLVYIGDAAGEKGVVSWKNTEDGSIVTYGELYNTLELMRQGRGPLVELAVTGRAFNLLLTDGIMRKILLDTRIFARMTPEDKVRCVRLHMEKAVTAMCGDGGNDAGALKAAHAGLALSEAEASVVSHFSARDRSIRSCVELLREARCSLDVGIASYKYLIMYGEVLAFMGLIQYYFTVNMSQALWILTDGATVPLSWALTMALPAMKLSKDRPTARLLGYETVLSVVGQIFIDVIFQICAIVMLFNQSWFRCNEFDDRGYDVRRWWELADNYEASVSGILGTFQIVHAAAAFSLGSKFRRGVLRNWIFLCSYGAIFVILSFIILAEPNTVGCWFRINCGSPETLDKFGYRSLFGAPEEYYNPRGHNVMPVSFRWQLWALCVGNLIVLIVFQALVILGPVRTWAMKRWPLKRQKVRL
ncbi:hypothetical protein HK098_006844 [Nowakowskiella sp. JEL0407]|nr:hypothetical protein HK098_006844 [Nowakowskiella sp. JEL0407]